MELKYYPDLKKYLMLQDYCRFLL